MMSWLSSVAGKALSLRWCSSNSVAGKALSLRWCSSSVAGKALSLRWCSSSVAGKALSLTVSSLRVDTVAAKGLTISRKSVLLTIFIL